jgi:hypothetical protein
MNKQELVEIIRTIVKEEIVTSLPDVLVEILATKVNEREIVTEQKETFSPTIKRQSMVSLDEPIIPSKPVSHQPPKRYSTNPVLNAVLNETKGGVPKEDEVASASVLDTIKTIPKEVLAENTAVQAVAGALTRDYRSFLKKVAAKAPGVPKPL